MQSRLKLESKTMCWSYFSFFFNLLLFFYFFFLLSFLFNFLLSFQFEKVEQREEREVIWSVGVESCGAERDMGKMEQRKKSGIDEPSPSLSRN